MTSPTAVDSSVTHRLLMMAVRYTSWWAMVPNCARLKCPFSEKAFTNMLTSGTHSNSSTISPRGTSSRQRLPVRLICCSIENCSHQPIKGMISSSQRVAISVQAAVTASLSVKGMVLVYSSSGIILAESSAGSSTSLRMGRA